jgi:hypothetical protein
VAASGQKKEAKQLSDRLTAEKNSVLTPLPHIISYPDRAAPCPDIPSIVWIPHPKIKGTYSPSPAGEGSGFYLSCTKTVEVGLFLLCSGASRGRRRKNTGKREKCRCRRGKIVL